MLPGSVQEVEVPEDVIREEADGEEDHHKDRQFDALPFDAGVNVPIPAENYHHVAVASEDDEKGDDKPRHGDGQDVELVSAQVFIPCRIVAPCPIGIHLAEGEIRRHLEDDPAPDHCTEEKGRAQGLAPAPHLQRVDDAPVALDADAGQEADAGVEVEVEEAAGQPAHSSAEEPGPALQVVSHQEGQGDHVEQVGHPQVAEQQAQGAPAPPPRLGAQVAEPQPVAQQPRQAHGQVDGRQEALREPRVHRARHGAAVGAGGARRPGHRRLPRHGQRLRPQRGAELRVRTGEAEPPVPGRRGGPALRSRRGPLRRPARSLQAERQRAAAALL